MASAGLKLQRRQNNYDQKILAAKNNAAAWEADLGGNYFAIAGFDLA